MPTVKSPAKGLLAVGLFVYFCETDALGRTPLRLLANVGVELPGASVFILTGIRNNVDIDQDALDKLSALARAQEDANKLKASELNILRRAEQWAMEEREATVKLRSEVERMITDLRELSEHLAANNMALQVLTKEARALREEVGKIDDNTLLLLTERNQPAVREAIDETSRRKRKRQHRKNLDNLLEEAATYGSGNQPLKLRNQIEREQQALDELED
jgi:hypothetical protein